MLDTMLNNQYLSSDAIIAFIISIVVFFVSLSLHEFAHGLAAYKMGDPTPKIQGRLTVNPLKHLDLMGFISFILFRFGWAKPMPVNPLNFKKYRTGIRIVSLAGILTNVLLGVLAAVIHAVLMSTIGIPNMAMYYVYMLLYTFMVVNSCLAIFNLLPIYPLDGYNFVSSFIKTENKYVKFNLRYGLILIYVVLVINIILNRMCSFNFLTLLSSYIFEPIAFLGVA